jgi:nicotinate-nucleotide adenylyltransferase
MAKIRLGVMGGTFDPIHNGHLVAASEVAAALKLDQVVFVPTGAPENKPEVTGGEHRYLMTVIATAANPRFLVSRVDIDRDKPTYTVDTLTDLKNTYPDAELFFITGSDAIAQILAWKEVQRLWDLAQFVAVSRPGHALQIPDVPEGTVTVVEVPALSISSTDCRNRVSNGEPIWYLVPDGVVQYIGKHGLYKGLS